LDRTWVFVHLSRQLFRRKIKLVLVKSATHRIARNLLNKDASRMNINSLAQNVPVLDRLLRPKSVAILGASNDPLRISGRPLSYMLRLGFKGRLYPVNNRRTEVQGQSAYPSLADLPESPDVALIALPAEAVAGAVAECAAKGVAAAVIYAAGFAELSESGLNEQKRILDIAKEGNVRLIGPNCIGVLNNHDGFAGTFCTVFSDSVPAPSNLAIVAQSGAYAGHLAHMVRERNMGVGYWVTTGNEADIDVAEVVKWMAERDDVSVIMTYLEGARNGAALANALRIAHERRKAVICMKVGRSAIGGAAAKSHTASMVGSDAVYEALFEQYGVHRANTTEEQIDIAYAALRGIYPPSRKTGILTVSGGFGIQLCDAAERHHLDLTPLPETAGKRLKEINPLGAAANPCDMTASVINDMSQITRTFATMYEYGGYDAIVASLTYLPDSGVVGKKMRDAIAAGTDDYHDRLTVLCMAADVAVMNAYDADGFLVYRESERAIAAIAGLAKLREGFERNISIPEIDHSLARQLPAGALSEATAETVLAGIGIPFLPGRLVTDAEEAVRAAHAIGKAVAMKIISPDIQHKTEIGGVILNLEGEEAVRAAYRTLRERATSRRPAAKIEGISVRPMAGEGIETILGVNRDPMFGPVVMFGLGGVFTELLDDVAFRIAPFDRAEALRMIQGIKGYSLLAGYRNKPAVDIDALADTLVRLSAFAAANDRIESIDLNPILVRAHGVVALDAVLVTR